MIMRLNIALRCPDRLLLHDDFGPQQFHLTNPFLKILTIFWQESRFPESVPQNHMFLAASGESQMVISNLRQFSPASVAGFTLVC